MPATEITPEAEADILDACTWYSGQRDGLGLEFFDEVVAAIERIEDRPLAFALVHRTVRRALIRRFPYYIVYLPDGDSIKIIACLHASRSPRTWIDRLDK